MPQRSTIVDRIPQTVKQRHVNDWMPSRYHPPPENQNFSIWPDSEYFVPFIRPLRPLVVSKGYGFWAKIPTASTPQIPPTPWTAEAPTGSSIPILSNKGIETQVSNAPIAPTTIDSHARQQICTDEYLDLSQTKKFYLHTGNSLP